MTNPLGNSISFETDTQGRIIRMTDAEGQSSAISYSYKNKGSVVTKTNSLNQATVYQFDSQGRLTGITLPSGDEMAQTYDVKGRLEQQIDWAGDITKMQYGATGTQQADMPAGIIYPTYHTSAQFNALGLPTDITQLLGEGIEQEQLTTRLSYNALGMLLSMTIPNGATTQIQYDAHGNQVKHIDALGNTIQQTYDA